MKTIGVFLNSGLGNQLFMIFALISYCIDNLCDCVIYYDRNKTKCYWDSILDGFEKFSSDEKNIIKTDKVYNEPHFHFQNIPEMICNFNLKGYFQSHKYFQHNFNKIKDVMKLDEKQTLVFNEYSKLYFNKKTIALHFRIGDYIGLQAYHCIKGPNYYVNAIKKIIELLNQNGENICDYNILYFCQSCDNNIVDKYIDFFKKTFINNTLNFVKIDDNIIDWKQLLIMSHCDHFIIANSTFSWFGAYFSNTFQKNNKIVCYPSIWFGPFYNNHDTKDMYPNDWIPINDV